MCTRTRDTEAWARHLLVLVKWAVVNDPLCEPGDGVDLIVCKKSTHKSRLTV
jgi:hypothetical protein